MCLVEFSADGRHSELGSMDRLRALRSQWHHYSPCLNPFDFQLGRDRVYVKLLLCSRMVPMAQEKWTPDSVARILMNPAYVLTDPSVVPEEKWIEANAKLIGDLGAHTYLATLLDVLRNNQQL